MTFSIRINGKGEPGRLMGEIVLGNESETFRLITTLWAPTDYKAQWREALVALTDGRVSACVLVTDIQPSEASHGLMYWALFRIESTVVLQERLLRDRPERLLGPAEVVEHCIPPRIQGTAEEHAQVSEWTISIDEIALFLAED